ncbi:MAG: nucleoside deaminase [Anaerolineae bacterium]|nr:nucleoside deaminase [Anaerolineae bacterium]
MRLPAWIAEEIGDPERRYPELKDRMALAIRLSARNILEGGGPFGAAVFEIETGKLVAPGVNIVVQLRSSLAHAEAMAIMIAQTVCKTHDLSAAGLPPMELVTSAQPCIQCYGNLWWSGLRRLVVGARKEDVESLTGFAEGPVPDDWARHLSDRAPLPSIVVIRDVLRDEARQVLQRYREQGGSIYNPG